MYLELAWSLPPWKDKIITDKFKKEMMNNATTG
jgi:hypothetical protein